MDPGGSNTPADYNNPEAYTLNLKLKSEYALGAAETLVISYDEGFGITDASGSNQLRGFEQVVSNNSTAQGRDTTAPTPQFGDTSQSGSSITIDFNEPLDSSSNLQNLQNNNTLSVYVDGQQLNSADIRYIASPAPHITDHRLLDLSYDGAEKIQIAPVDFSSTGFDFVEALNNNSFQLRVDGIEQNGLIQSIDSVPNAYGEGIEVTLIAGAADAFNNAGDIQVMFDGMNRADGSRVEGFSQNLRLNNNGAAGMAPAPVGMGTLVIGLADKATLKSGQTVFVTYNGGELRDYSNNHVKSFTQVVNNTSALANDRTNPTITGSPSINPDGNSFQLKFSEAISKDSLTSFDTNQFKLFVDGVEQTAGSFSIDPSQFDGPLGNAGAPAADVPINEVTVQINGSTIEVGQNVLLSYAINDPNGATGITDTSGNNLANFTYQLENFSAKDYTAPEGWTDPTNGNFIRFGFSENVAHFSDYDAATNSVAGNIFDPNRIKDAITINVDGRNLNPADYSLEPDGNGIRINLVNQYSRIYEGQTVTLSYDESLIPEADRLIDYSGNLLERGTQLVTNDSALTAPDLIPPSLDFSSSSADGQTISLTFSEQLNDIPDKNAFRLSFNGIDVGLCSHRLH